MRSALDRLAWALVERKVVGGGEPPRETAFPIYRSYDAYLKTSNKSGELTSRSGLIVRPGQIGLGAEAAIRRLHIPR